MSTGQPSFAQRLIDWAAHAGRHDLPWQVTPTPYRVWVSEIMLQQTQVGTVLPYYQRFMARFPQVEDLAAAPLDTVLHLWSGLGYYSRARNLHRAARIVVERFGGVFPDTLADMQSLPGIGRSTAAAILALALGRSETILDGNVKRVIARHRGIAGWPGERAVQDALWRAAEAATPAQGGAAAYTQAIMDLGATVCLRRRPHCLLCPVSADCVARASGSIDALPGARPKRARPLRTTQFAIVRDAGGRVFLEQRPPRGVWGGLWSFPELPAHLTLERWCEDRLGVRPWRSRALPLLRHHFTHFELHISPWLADIARLPEGVADGERVQWYDPESPSSIGLAAAVTRLLGQLPDDLGR